jgi:hypothetical protein
MRKLLALIFIGLSFMSIAQKPEWLKPNPEGRSVYVQGISFNREDSAFLVTRVEVVNLDNNETYSWPTNATGVFQFHVWENGKYLLLFKSEGYISRRVTIDTHNVPPKQWKKGQTVSIRMGMDKKPEGFPEGKFSKPFAEFVWFQEDQTFLFDTDVTDRFMAEYFEELKKYSGKEE